MLSQCVEFRVHVPVIGNFFSTIWDTSHWNFLSNLD